MKSIIQTIIKNSFGQWSLAMLMISLFSGVFLIVPFDVENAYTSIIKLMITNPYAAFFRNLHYWSSQFFLIFAVLHIFDHLLRKTDRKITSGIWFRLVGSILIIYMVMLSGFLLKADTDSKQAWEILQFLLTAIPIVGDELAYFILGNNSEKLLIPYIHHVATFSILIVFMLFEHARILWPKSFVFVISILSLSIISSFLAAPLHLGSLPILKGPWYFVGFQEILHWMSHPAWSLLIVLFILSILFLFKFLPQKFKTVLAKGLILIGIVYLFLTFIGFFFRGENWQWNNQMSGNTNDSYIHIYNVWGGQETPNEALSDIQEKESCMWCHSNTSGFSPSHDVAAIGCYSCHLGNKLSTNKYAAHKGMVLMAGNYSNASITCGSAECHPNELEHIQKSLMSTNSGLVAVDKYVFHESDNLDAKYHIKEIGHSPAETHLRNLCASCHLGREKDATGPIDEKSRGGGCLACHLNYPEKQMQSFNNYHNGAKLDSMPTYFHPRVDLAIDNSKCFGCHSRSGRISTNYEGWHETNISHKKFVAADSLRLLQDKRVFRFVEEDVHHKAGLSCIDCHQYKDVMGDGGSYAHQEEAVKIQCQDCHASSYTQTVDFENLSREEKNVFLLRDYTHDNKSMIKTEKENATLVNTIVHDKNNAELIGKLTNKIYKLKAPLEVCTSLAHQNVSCALCHSSWVPQCIGCHNEYDANDDRAYDLLDKERKTGEWNEFVGKYFVDLPVIGVREDGHIKTYEPSTPGMIMTIDTASFSSKEGDMVFHRLYAPASPHTTQAKGRNCKSCHQNALALGFGRGELNYLTTEDSGYWEFTSKFAKSKYDKLPEDAWTDFIDGEKPSGSSTRSNFRALNKNEQEKMLLVGACLHCHLEDSKLIKRILRQDFNSLIQQKSSACKLP